MKRKRAKEILVDSFRELAQGMSINKITVQDIVKNCDYSVATFYRQFKDKYDLIAWDYSREVEKILDQIGDGESSWIQALGDAASYYETHREYLLNLLLHTSGYDSFAEYMTEINYNSLRNCILSSMDGQKPDEKTDIYIRIYCVGTVRITCEWILGKYNIDSRTLKEIYESALPKPLLQYLA